MSNVYTNIQVICTGHSGWLNAETKKSFDKAYAVETYKLKQDGYVQSNLHHDLFVRNGTEFARIHNINDWKQTSEEYTKEISHPSRAGHYIRNLIKKGPRFHSAEAFVSKWKI